MLEGVNGLQDDRRRLRVPVSLPNPASYGITVSGDVAWQPPLPIGHCATFPGVPPVAAVRAAIHD
jgi:hypothetical protein